jgi:hypothetical protein
MFITGHKMPPTLNICRCGRPIVTELASAVTWRLGLQAYLTRGISNGTHHSNTLHHQ